MARTIQQVITEARGYLQDTVEEYRYSDDSLIVYLNNAILETRRIRPDAFVNAYDAAIPQFTTADLAADLPIDSQFYTAIAYFVAGSASLQDDEHVVDSRATGLLALFSAKLTRPGA